MLGKNYSLNILSAVNGLLQKRTEILEDRRFYFQNKLANELNNKINEIKSFLTSALNFHLNLGQQYTIDTTSPSPSNSYQTHCYSTHLYSI